MVEFWFSYHTWHFWSKAQQLSSFNFPGSAKDCRANLTIICMKKKLVRQRTFHSIHKLTVKYQSLLQIKVEIKLHFFYFGMFSMGFFAQFGCLNRSHVNTTHHYSLFRVADIISWIKNYFLNPRINVQNNKTQEPHNAHWRDDLFSFFFFLFYFCQFNFLFRLI